MTARLFVALWPPTPVVHALARALAPLAEAYPELRWQTPDRWHITVAFLGDRDEQRTVARFQGLPPATAGTLQLEAGGHFGPVLWAGVAGADWLSPVAAEVQRRLRTEERRFRAHVTVGRVRTAAGRRQVVRAAADLASFCSPPWIPDEMTLVRSTIGPHPAFEVIASTPLTAVAG